jgi:Rrf2 family cysteine metabolism transcriptional repressor
MKLSTRTRYAARAMAELATLAPGATRSLRELAENQGLSKKYYESIFSLLKSGGLVKSIRGLDGGYSLAKPPTEITLRDVYEILEGPICPVECVDNPDSCERLEICPTRDTWVEVQRAVTDVLQRTTIQDLADRATQKATSTPDGSHLTPP